MPARAGGRRCRSTTRAWTWARTWSCSTRRRWWCRGTSSRPRCTGGTPGGPAASRRRPSRSCRRCAPALVCVLCARKGVRCCLHMYAVQTLRCWRASGSVLCCQSARLLCFKGNRGHDTGSLMIARCHVAWRFSLKLHLSFWPLPGRNCVQLSQRRMPPAVEVRGQC